MITRPVLFAPWAVMIGREANDALLGARSSLPQAGQCDLSRLEFGICTDPFVVPANPVRVRGLVRDVQRTPTRPRGAGAPIVGDHQAA